MSGLAHNITVLATQDSLEVEASHGSPAELVHLMSHTILPIQRLSAQAHLICEHLRGAQVVGAAVTPLRLDSRNQRQREFCV